MLAYISACSGVIGFKVGTWLCPVREKVRPARPDVCVSAKKFALRLCFSTQARKSSPCELKTPHIRRFCACGASFFAEVPV